MAHERAKRRNRRIALTHPGLSESRGKPVVIMARRRQAEILQEHAGWQPVDAPPADRSESPGDTTEEKTKPANTGTRARTGAGQPTTKKDEA
ncbi:hypothetical protein [Phytoactinopolyspora limicola]|uniref:hypothetical protein n=1 Tax=Phytoactinopolyspora limicola TaxID=2715536 RepID=UPI001408DD24|nr:hypothetical protein [Phytoactinopolyspora limicola]